MIVLLVYVESIVDSTKHTKWYKAQLHGHGMIWWYVAITKSPHSIPTSA